MNTTHVAEKTGQRRAVGQLTSQVTCSQPPAATQKLQIQSLGQIAPYHMPGPLRSPGKPGKQQILHRRTRV